jgi:hypothetical protein
MSAWLWVNLALGALFVAAIVGVPLWLVIARPDTGSSPRPSAAPARQPATPAPVAVPRPVHSSRTRLPRVWPDVS